MVRYLLFRNILILNLNASDFTFQNCHPCEQMQPCDEDVTDIEVKSDGSWRVKIARPFMDLEKWHIPDGSLSVSDCKPGSSIAGVSSEKSQPQSTNENGGSEHMTDGGQEIISMSSGSSDDMEEGEIQSTTRDVTVDSAPYNRNTCSSSLGDLDVIVLSDSEEENYDTVSATPGPPTASFNSPIADPEPPDDMHIDDAVFPAGISFFNCNLFVYY